MSDTVTFLVFFTVFADTLVLLAGAYFWSTRRMTDRVIMILLLFLGGWNLIVTMMVTKAIIAQ